MKGSKLCFTTDGSAPTTESQMYDPENPDPNIDRNTKHLLDAAIPLFDQVEVELREVFNRIQSDEP